MKEYVSVLTGVCLFTSVLLAAGCGEGDAAAGFSIHTLTPGENEELATLKDSLVIKFTQDVNPKTLTAQSVKVLDLMNHELVSGNVSYDAAALTATFAPLSGWMPKGHYRATVHHRVESMLGAKHLPASKTWEFQAPANPAKVWHFEPYDLEEDVSPKTEIAVQFGETLDATTVTAATFQLIGPGGVVVPAKVSAPTQGMVGQGSGHDPNMPMFPPPGFGSNKAGDHATLNPTDLLQPGVKYTVKLTSQITSLTGVGIEPKEWSFTTTSTISSTLLIGSDQEDDITSVASSGADVYVLGNTRGAITSKQKLGEQDLFVTKRTGVGAEVWTKQFGTTAYDAGQSLAVDAAGNVFVLAMNDPSVSLAPPTKGSGGGFGMPPVSQVKGVIYKLAPAADEVPKSVEFGPASNYMGVDRIIADSAGNVYVTGVFDGTLGNLTSVGGPDAYLMKYSSNLDLLWAISKGTVGGENSSRIALGRNGSLYWGMSTDGDFSTPTRKPETYASRAVVFKLDATTQAVASGWPVTIGGKAGRNIADIGLDEAGNVYVGGTFYGDNLGYAPGLPDGFLAKVNPDTGVHADPFEWSSDSGSGGRSESYDDFSAMIVRPDGTVYLAGTTQVQGPLIPCGGPGGGGFCSFTIGAVTATKIDLALATPLVWAKNMPSKEHAGGSSLTLSTLGELIVVGVAHGSFGGQIPAGGSDGFFARIDSANGAIK